MDPLVTARYGLLAAERRFEASAVRVAQGGADGDYAQEVVGMITAKQEFSANLGVIRFAEDMWRALLDIQSK